MSVIFYMIHLENVFCFVTCDYLPLLCSLESVAVEWINFRCSGRGLQDCRRRSKYYLSWMGWKVYKLTYQGHVNICWSTIKVEELLLPSLHLFKFNNENTRTMCKVCSKLTIAISFRCLFMFNMKRFHILLCCFHC